MAQAFVMKDKQIRDLEKSLGSFKHAIPIADQRARNDAVFDAQKTARKIVEKKMVNRNRWTKGSIQIEKSSRGFSSPAKVGSLQEYMADQEFGAVAGKDNAREGRRMTTPYASGEGLNARPRKKVARGANKIKRITLSNRRQVGKNKRQRAIIAVRQTIKSGKKYVFLDMPWTRGKKGIYKILGGKKKPRLRMVHSMKKQSVVIPKNPWLGPTVDSVNTRIPRYYVNRLTEQYKRHFRK